MKKVPFGVTKDGKEASRYILKNAAGMQIELSDFGAHILSVLVPDKTGQMRDVVLGYDTLEEYYDNDCGFGAYIGRNGNRIQGANVTLDGVLYQLEANDNGNNLHSGSDRSHYKFYETVTGKSDKGEFVQFKRVSPHMEQGFPGNLDQTITYTLTEASELVIEYEMESDKATVVNPTNHSYFNLAGHDSGDILSHELEMTAVAYLPTDAELIPTGEIVPVDGTPMDFSTAKAVGRDIEAEFLPLQLGGGYDHNFVFQHEGKVREVARLHSLESGITMKVLTDLDGVQVYSGNFLDGKKGKGGAVYEKRGGICFETQFYPNACKEPNFPTSVLEAGKRLKSCTIYQFGIE